MKDLYSVMSCIWYSSSSSPDTLNKRWVQALLEADVEGVVQAFKAIDYRLITVVESSSSFNHWRRSTYPFMGQIIVPLKDEIDLFCEEKVGLKKLRTCLLFITRANFPEPIGLEEEAFEQWKDRNLQPAGNQPSDWQAAVLSRIFPRKLRFNVLFRPRFGPGQTADLGKLTDLEAKYLAFRDDAKLRYFAAKVGYPTSDLPYRKDGLERVGELRFVPKELNKLRVITAEPSSLMFYQQGVFSWMMDIISKSPWRHHIDLERADLNQDLAWEGSISGEYATIDLSSASDLVKYQHVRFLFNNTCLREALISTRSNSVRYEDKVLTPEYFAPMGSACCFPVETAYFASIVGAIMERHRDRRAWRVYGDDIIVPSDHFDEVVECLENLGHVVNVDKSFTGNCHFRESCGGDYYDGEDVRPVRVSRRWQGLKINPHRVTTIEGNVDLANRLVHFPLARLRVLKALKKARPGVIFDDTGEKGVWSKDPTNFHLPSRYNTDIQSMEYQCGHVFSPKERGCPDIAYYEWLRARELDNSPVAESDTSVGPSKNPVWGTTWSSPAPGWKA